MHQLFTLEANETDGRMQSFVVYTPLVQALSNPPDYEPTFNSRSVCLHETHAARGADEAGYSCSGGFDINGDGFSDFIIGAPSGGTAGEFNGEAYVVFGQVRDDISISAKVEHERTKSYRASTCNNTEYCICHTI